MLWATDRGHQNLGVEIVIAVDGANIGDQIHPDGADIVHPADKRRDIAGARFRRQQRLGRGKAECHINRRASVGQRLAGFQTIHGQRHFNANIGGDRGQGAAFGEHGVEIGGRYLGADMTVDQIADFGHHLEKRAAGLGHQRGVGGHPVQHAGCRQFGDFGDIRRIDKKLHALRLFRAWAPPM